MQVEQQTRNAPIKRRVSQQGFVEGLNMAKLVSGIRWIGNVRWHMLNENCPSMLSDCEYPPKSGRFYYACPSTGMLFDKQTGVCRQSTRVELDVSTVVPHKCTPEAFRKLVKSRIESAPRDITLGNKRGPKPRQKPGEAPDVWAEVEQEADIYE